MCLYPKLIKNKKYEPNKKNGGIPPKPKDSRVLLVPVKCGRCMECRKAISREWQIRLQEEIKHDNSGQFVTLTFNDEQLWKLTEELGTKVDSNELCTIAIRRFLERWRRKSKKSVKHWLITEHGHTSTERIHLHGLLFTTSSKTDIEQLWQYGTIWTGNYVNCKTVNYIVKYITKLDSDHPGFQGKVHCSPGIGRKYEQSFNAQQNGYKEKKTDETYKLSNGAKVALPVYYRNKIYSEEEREKLWLEKIDKGKRFVNGVKTDVRTSQGRNHYYRALDEAQRLNRMMGYGDRSWTKKKYAASRTLLEN